MIRYKIVPEIEAFDLSHIFQASQLFKYNKLKGKPYIQFVMGLKMLCLLIVKFLSLYRNCKKIDAIS